MAGCWKKVYYRVSDYSTYYFWLQLIVNSSMVVVSLIAFYTIGQFKVMDENNSEVNFGTGEIVRGIYFTNLFLLMVGVSQTYVGMHAVG